MATYRSDNYEMQVVVTDKDVFVHVVAHNRHNSTTECIKSFNIRFLFPRIFTSTRLRKMLRYLRYVVLAERYGMRMYTCTVFSNLYPNSTQNKLLERYLEENV